MKIEIRNAEIERLPLSPLGERVDRTGVILSRGGPGEGVAHLLQASVTNCSATPRVSIFQYQISIPEVSNGRTGSNRTFAGKGTAR
ncbi:hypothetical protein SBA2_90029 [Acidobacteriia bacterium SbA2]|nr:hypothetical protein SBA2_90029 [Acidobacteriia bacterium SbA2]